MSRKPRGCIGLTTLKVAHYETHGRAEFKNLLFLPEWPHFYGVRLAEH
jgi:hypothetical protein